MNKTSVLTILLALGMSACGTTITIPNVKNPITYGTQPVVEHKTFRLADSHWADVAKIRAEALRLGMQVQNGELTRVQAAQALNQYRLRIVGENSVDNSVYDVYLRAAVDAQRNIITREQARSYLENTLQGWLKRWPNIDRKPNNPAFTNFLLEHLEMETLK